MKRHGDCGEQNRGKGQATTLTQLFVVTPVAMFYFFRDFN